MSRTRRSTAREFEINTGRSRNSPEAPGECRSAACINGEIYIGARKLGKRDNAAGSW